MNKTIDRLRKGYEHRAASAADIEALVRKLWRAGEPDEATLITRQLSQQTSAYNRTFGPPTVPKSKRTPPPMVFDGAEEKWGWAADRFRTLYAPLVDRGPSAAALRHCFVHAGVLPSMVTAVVWEQQNPDVPNDRRMTSFADLAAWLARDSRPQHLQVSILGSGWVFIGHSTRRTDYYWHFCRTSADAYPVTDLP